MVIEDEPATLRLSTVSDYGKDRVLSTSIWNYVALWMERRKSVPQDALFYWQQAESFYQAAEEVPIESSPLLYYYSFLNSSKALFEAKSRDYSPYHGLTTEDSPPGRTALGGEEVKVKPHGVFQSLYEYDKSARIIKDRTFDLRRIFRNVVSVHHAYNRTYRSDSSQPLFLRLRNHRFCEDDAGSVVLQAVIEAEEFRGQSQGLISHRLRNFLTEDFSIIESQKDKILIQSNQAASSPSPNDLEELNRNLRERIDGIWTGTDSRFYLRKQLADTLPWPQICRLFAGMFYFGRRVRYDPKTVRSLLEHQQNWLVSEFIEVAPIQFLVSVAGELTGDYFSTPYAVGD